MDRGQRIEQMVARDGAARAVSLPVVVGQHQSRPAGPIDDPRGEDPQNTSMPLWIVHHEDRGGEVAVLVSQRSQSFVDCFEGFGLGRLAVVVQAVEL